MDVNEEERLSNITFKTETKVKEQRSYCWPTMHSLRIVLLLVLYYNNNAALLKLYLTVLANQCAIFHIHSLAIWINKYEVRRYMDKMVKKKLDDVYMRSFFWINYMWMLSHRIIKTKTIEYYTNSWCFRLVLLDH